MATTISLFTYKPLHLFISTIRADHPPPGQVWCVTNDHFERLIRPFLPVASLLIDPSALCNSAGWILPKDIPAIGVLMKAFN